MSEQSHKSKMPQQKCVWNDKVPALATERWTSGHGCGMLCGNENEKGKVKKNAKETRERRRQYP